VPGIDARALVETLERHIAARASAEWADGLLAEPERIGWCRLSRSRRAAGSGG
jgi:hypothetical protein